MIEKKTLVLGASDNPSRYSYLAINMLRKNGHDVIAIGNKETQVGDVLITKATAPTTEIDTITLYLSAPNQQSYYDYILSLNPKRIIFNPGTENEVLASLAQEKGIQTQEACTLVLLSSGQY